MALGSFDHAPPPFFRQGPSAFSKLMFFSALALFLMVADTRFKLTQPIRAVVATALHPVERMLQVPVVVWETAGSYLMGLQKALATVKVLRSEVVRQAETLTRFEQLSQENERLRGLLDLRPALSVRSVPAEVLYEASDPFSRKVIVDRGSSSGVLPSSPVINEQGVLGQVTRVYPYSAEVTLLTDKDAAIPVLSVRTQTRSVAFGGARGVGMELRFITGNADVQVGDLFTTTGLDGVYPSGVPVARVDSVGQRVEANFARISLAPVASPDGVRHVLVLEPVGLQMRPRPGTKARRDAGLRKKRADQ